MKFIAIALLIFFNNFAQITEANKIAEIFNHIKDPSETLIIFDIDNTLARTERELGSDEWFSHLVNEKIKEGFNMLEAITHVVPSYYYAQFNLPLIFVEQDVLNNLNRLRSMNVPFIALTARSLYISERTFDQLSALKIEFDFLQDRRIALTLARPAIFIKGILFSGDNDKGEALVAFLDRVDYHPKNVVFIDDKRKNLVSVEEALIKRQINFIGIRYSGCDERVKNFNPDLAHHQWIELTQKNRL